MERYPVDLVVQDNVVSRSGGPLEGLVADEEEVVAGAISHLVEHSSARTGVVIFVCEAFRLFAFATKAAVVALHRANNQ